MSKTQQLPVLPLADVVVLPGMVVPVTLDDAERQAAIDAANVGGGRPGPGRAAASTASTPWSASSRRSSSSGKLPGGEPAAVLRAGVAARVGSGVTGPGSALWVEAEILDEVLGGEASSELCA